MTPSSLTHSQLQNTETGGARFDANENTLSNQLGR